MDRTKILQRAGRLLLERNGVLAELETLDTGKAVAATAEVDIITGAEVLEYYAGLALSLHGEHVDLPPQAFVNIRREAIGARGYKQSDIGWENGLVGIEPYVVENNLR